MSTQRIDLAIKAMSGTGKVSHLGAEHEVSRKFVYQQKDKARLALVEAFATTAPDDAVLFHLPVSKTWLNQLTLSLTLICHSSCRGVVELMRDMLGVSVSEGSVHNLHQAATGRAGAINRAQDLSAIHQALLDEIFHCNEPVLVGVDARSTYCFLLAAEAQRDAETWAIHHLYARDQGFNPHYAIADAGAGLRSGYQLVWEDKPCHGDVFHILHQCEGLTNVLTRVAQGATSRRQAMEVKMDGAKEDGTGHTLARQLGMARHAQVQASHLAKDVKTLTQWLRRDVLALAGPCLATRIELFNFVTAELLAREPLDSKRIRPVRVAL
jgi:hypothetical protein